MRTTLVWRRAMRLPTVMVTRGEHPEQRLPRRRSRPQKPTKTSVSSATKPAALEATARNAVTGVGRALVGVGRPGVERARPRP